MKLSRDWTLKANWSDDARLVSGDETAEIALATLFQGTTALDEIPENRVVGPAPETPPAASAPSNALVPIADAPGQPGRRNVRARLQ